VKKTAAFLVYFFFALWILFAAFITISVSGWVTDKNFYKSIAGDVRLYEAAGTKLYDGFAEKLNSPTGPMMGKIDNVALSAALSTALPPSVIASKANSIIDTAFAAFDTNKDSFTINMSEIKKEILGERRAQIASVYVANLKQSPAIPDVAKIENLSTLPKNVTAAQMEAAFNLSLDPIVNSIKDEYAIDLSGPRGEMSNKDTTLGVPSKDTMLYIGLGLLAAGLVIVFALALMVEQNWYLRLAYVGSKIMPPAIIALIIGGLGMILTDAQFMGDLYQKANRAISDSTDLIGPMLFGAGDVIKGIVRTATGGFFWTGLIAASVAGGLISMRRIAVPVVSEE
jgi:hypothetical protein